MAAQYRETRTFHADYPTLFSSCQNAVATCKFQLLRAFPDQGLIHASVGISLWSFGEKIEIHVGGTGEVFIKSECAFPTQIVSWGRNKRNVQRLFEAVEASLSPRF